MTVLSSLCATGRSTECRHLQQAVVFTHLEIQRTVTAPKNQALGRFSRQALGSQPLQSTKMRAQHIDLEDYN